MTFCFLEIKHSPRDRDECTSKATWSGQSALPHISALKPPALWQLCVIAGERVDALQIADPLCSQTTSVCQLQISAKKKAIILSLLPHFGAGRYERRESP